MRYHRNGRFLNGSGRWGSVSELEEIEPREVLQAYAAIGGGRDETLPPGHKRLPTKRGYFRGTAFGPKSSAMEQSIGPRSDLHELILWMVQKAVKKSGHGNIVNCRGRQVYSVDRDPKSKRWFVRLHRASHQTHIPIAKLERDRMLLRDMEDPRIYWVML